MAEGGQVSKAQLKRQLEQLGEDLFSIDLQIQRMNQGQQHRHMSTLEQVKLDIQKQVVSKEAQLAKLNAQTRKARRR